ncbi:hypothetical protein GCM10017691_10780 [Pseudonocardia petroleophila]
MVRNAQFAWSDPVPGGVVYPVGSDAALQVTIINEESAGLDDGDRLVAVSSPVAGDGRIPQDRHADGGPAGRGGGRHRAPGGGRTTCWPWPRRPTSSPRTCWPGRSWRRPGPGACR